MKRLLENVLAIVVLITPVVIMVVGFWLMGLTNYEVENINYTAGLPLAVFGVIGSIGSCEYIASILNE